jgi:hypothetical protein
VPTTKDVDEIRRKMADLRMDMHREMTGVRAGTEAATSWQYYVKHYPWATLAAAAALGYLAVPRKHRDLKVVVPQVEAGETKAEKRTRKGLFALALGFLGPIAVRAAQGYAVNYLDAMMARNSMPGPDGVGLGDEAPSSGWPGSVPPASGTGPTF